MDELTERVSRNLAAIREERRYSLDDLAEVTGVSRSMLRQIEKGESSPTISTLWKIANGLKVSFTSLVKEARTAVAVIDNTAGTPIVEKDQSYCLYPLFPFEPDRKFESYFVQMRAGARLESEGHRGEVEEYVFVTQGALRLGVGEESFRVDKDHSIRFPASGPHSYRNEGTVTVKMIMIIYYARS
jgi:XRE family transcriptional regulator, regulator of sulfur utilization